MVDLLKEFPKLNPKYLQEIDSYGSDILNSINYQKTKTFMQHGNISVYEHSILVAHKCLEYADNKKYEVNRRLLVRSALLHDYFEYDWHIKDKNRPWHASNHPHFAADNAIKDFKIGKIEENAIRSHMWPLGNSYPKSKEAWILFWADKDSAFKETLSKKEIRQEV